MQRYETKAAQCEERVQQAADEPQRALFDVLARYYGEQRIAGKLSKSGLLSNSLPDWAL